MGKNNLIVILGVLVAFLPFLGFPQKIKTVIFVFFGLLISFLAYRIGRKMMKIGGKQNHF